MKSKRIFFSPPSLGVLVLLLGVSLTNLTPALASTTSTSSLASTPTSKVSGRTSKSFACVDSIPSGGAATKKAAKKVASKKAAEQSSEGGQSITAATFNLVKTAVGSGALCLPAAVAAMGDTSAALVPASILMTILGGLSAYSFYTIGKLCAEEDAKSFGEVWSSIMGKESSWIVTTSCMVTPLGAALGFSICLGDFMSSLAKTIGIQGFMASRHFAILALTSLVIYPLCCLKSLAVLAPVSIVGVLGTVVIAAFMYLRMVGESYLEGGAFYDTIAEGLRPSFDKRGLKVFSPSTSILIGMAATAYLAHFVAPEFYTDLQNNTLERFATLTASGFVIISALTIVLMAFGFATFGGNSAGMVLNNYSTQDPGATIVRLLTAVSLIGSYPFAFGAVRTNFIELFYKDKAVVTDKNRANVTRNLLLLITSLALLLENAGFVVGFNGALMGSSIIYIFPSLMYLKSTKARIEKGALEKTTGVQMERLFNRLLILVGVMCAILGSAVSVIDSFFPHLLLRGA